MFMNPLTSVQVLERVRRVASARGKQVAYMLDTKGPEIRTAMLKGGQPVQLNAGEGAGGSFAGQRLCANLFALVGCPTSTQLVASIAFTLNPS
jgi:hypothetical protein